MLVLHSLLMIQVKREERESYIDIAVNDWFEVGPSTLEGMAMSLLHTHSYR